MLLLGLTGNIAAGKSSVAHAFAARGAVVIDSDVAAREAVAPGTPALRAIVDRFGPGMLLGDGTLDRSQLGARIFADTGDRQALERIVHPAVEASRQAAVRKARREGRQVLVCDIPLLFEARLVFQFPRVILVDASTATRVARLMHYRGATEAAARARVSAQLPAALKRERADLVIDNDGDLHSLGSHIDRAWEQVERWT